MTANDAKPHGRDEVVRALLQAAAELFATKGPAAVSLRDVAKEANVNVGLIHRHIGSKEDLVAAVLRERPGFGDLHRLAEVETPLDLVREVFAGRVSLAGITDIHVRMILDGYAIRDYQEDFPVIDWLVERLARDLPDEEARFRTMLLIAMVAGWRLFGEEYLAIVGLDHLDDDAVARLGSPAVQGLLDAPPVSPAPAPRRTRRA